MIADACTHPPPLGCPTLSCNPGEESCHAVVLSLPACPIAKSFFQKLFGCSNICRAPISTLGVGGYMNGSRLSSIGLPANAYCGLFGGCSVGFGHLGSCLWVHRCC